ncbi:MAG: ATP-binding protein [Nitrospirota bacterium]
MLKLLGDNMFDVRSGEKNTSLRRHPSGLRKKRNNINNMYNFSTDRHLRITSWGAELAALTGKASSATRGKKYFEVLPKLFSGDNDALSLAMEENRTITLNGHIFCCLLDRMSIDVHIEPLGTARKVRGVSVTLSNFALCSVAQNVRTSQRFIDIGKTASTLAHGVRNPLNAIKGAVVYLSEKYANESALIEFVKIMNEEITRLDNFISRFLSASISDAKFAPTDINSLLRKVEVFTSLQTHALNIESVYELGNIPLIMADVFQIEQAVLNVLNNAIDAMRSGGRLVVKTRVETFSGNDSVTIEISDTGSGITGKVTDVPSASVNRGGKGFGLFIAREVLRYHGGGLEITSKRGLGTSVRLHLPVKNGRVIVGS